MVHSARIWRPLSATTATRDSTEPASARSFVGPIPARRRWRHRAAPIFSASARSPMFVRWRQFGALDRQTLGQVNLTVTYEDGPSLVAHHASPRDKLDSGVSRRCSAGGPNGQQRDAI